MSWIKNILGAIAIGTIFTACQPEPLDITLPDYEPKTVVASQVLPGEIMFIGLTRSFTVLSSAGENGQGDSSTFENVLVDSALVYIEHSGQTDTLFKVSDGLYASLNTLDNPGTHYKLTVHDYGLNSKVTAETQMLENVKFHSIVPEVEKTNEDTIVTIKARFADNGADRNFYMVNVYSREILENGLDLNSFFSNGSNQVNATQLYTDADFNGDTASIEIEMDNLAYNDSIAVALSNISEEYYEFLRLRQKGGNLFSEITNEPINYPSNVQGGLGFFNTHFPDVEYFDLINH